jgi:DhnA family fructose-bisphosphate aldolase class Ia
MNLSMSRVVAPLAAAGVALLAGCASVPAATADAEVDFARIAQIERAARAFGTQVIWVNYPTKRTTATTE